jgi:hypothetical protein
MGPLNILWAAEVLFEALAYRGQLADLFVR